MLSNRDDLFIGRRFRGRCLRRGAFSGRRCFVFGAKAGERLHRLAPRIRHGVLGCLTGGRFRGRSGRHKRLEGSQQRSRLILCNAAKLSDLLLQQDNRIAKIFGRRNRGALPVGGRQIAQPVKEPRRHIVAVSVEMFRGQPMGCSHGCLKTRGLRRGRFRLGDCLRRLGPAFALLRFRLRRKADSPGWLRRAERIGAGRNHGIVHIAGCAFRFGVRRRRRCGIAVRRRACGFGRTKAGTEHCKHGLRHLAGQLGTVLQRVELLGDHVIFVSDKLLRGPGAQLANFSRYFRAAIIHFLPPYLRFKSTNLRRQFNQT